MVTKKRRANLNIAKQPKYTYYVKSDYYTEKYIDSVFDSALWKKVSDTERAIYIANKTPIDYIYLDGKHYYNPANFKLTSHVKNLVDDGKKVITSKNNLMVNLSKIPSARKFIMPQIELDLYKLHTNTQFRSKEMTQLSQLFNTKKVYIFKPVTGFAGQGIRIVTSMHELQSYISRIVKENRKSWNKGKKEKDTEPMRIWVLQEYLTDPLLIKQAGKNGKKQGDYKFHIRHYMFYVPGHQSYYVYEGEIAPARAPYVQGNWTNKLIHDTHFYGRDGELFPTALGLSATQTSSIYAQINELYGHILTCIAESQLIEPLFPERKEGGVRLMDSRSSVGVYNKSAPHGINAKCYAESRNCFELFGVDLMITQDYKVKVIEVNEKLGMPSSLTPMSRILFEGCLHKVVMPLIGLTDNKSNHKSHLENKYDKHFIKVKKNKERNISLQTKKVNVTTRLSHIVKTRKPKAAMPK
jgi:hypothetical protein